MKERPCILRLQKQETEQWARNKVSTLFFFLIIVETYRIVAHFRLEADADLNGKPAIEKGYIKVENKRRGE